MRRFVLHSYASAVLIIFFTFIALPKTVSGCPEGCICSIDDETLPNHQGGQCLRCRQGYRQIGRSCRLCPNLDCTLCNHHEDPSRCFLENQGRLNDGKVKTEMIPSRRPSTGYSRAAFASLPDVSLQQDRAELENSPTIFTVQEGGTVTISVVGQQNISSAGTGSGFINKNNSRKVEDKTVLHYTLITPPRLGSVQLSAGSSGGKVLRAGDVITRSDISSGRLLYRSEAEVGWKPGRDRIRWNVTLVKSAESRIDPGTTGIGSIIGDRDILVNGRVMDSSGKVLRKTEGSIKQSGLMKPSIHHENNNKDSQMGSSNSTGTTLFLAIEEVNVFIEPKDNQAPQLTLHGELVVDEGGVEIISPEIISFNDTDTQAEQLTILILDFPQHGYLEIRDDEKGRRKVGKEFPLSALLREHLSYVQSEHRSSEHRKDAIRFQLRDAGSNPSPPVQLQIAIENVNDEEPQVMTQPLVVVSNAKILALGDQNNKKNKNTLSTTDVVILTENHLSIRDRDTDPSDILISLTKNPVHGKLQRYDHLTNSERTLRVGEVFHYQDVLEGDVVFLCTAPNDTIHLKVSDGEFSEEVSIPFQRQPQNKSRGDDQTKTSSVLSESKDSSSTCVMEFNATEWIVQEDSLSAHVTVIRSGDLSVICSVLCATEAQQFSAEPGVDFDPRPVAESSRLFFPRGVAVAQCIVPIKDDQIHEGEEHFLVRLSQPQVETKLHVGQVLLNSTAMTGSKGQLTVRIRDEEDITRVQFNESIYRSSGDSVTIYVERSGDLRLPSKILVRGQDASAKQGRDYILGNRHLDFGPADRFASLQIFFKDRSTWSKSFQVLLAAEESVNAALMPGSRTTAIVFIPPSNSSGPALLPSEPIVVSLMDYENLDNLKSNGGKEMTAVAGYPVVCVTPCDPKYPSYNSTQRLCRHMSIDVSKVRFSWEISPPSSNDPIGEGVFYRLSQATAFSSVENRVLDSVFFGKDFRIRCVAQPARLSDSSASSVVFGPASVSRPVLISAQSGLCPAPAFTSDDKDGAMINGQQPFSASLTYINATDQFHPDTMRIQVRVPHYDGMIPILSTQPLYGIRHILHEPAYRLHHRCSNLHAGLGFLTSSQQSDSPAPSLSNEFYTSFRQESAVRLYRHLDLTDCLWNFEAWYTMTELVQLCGGQVTSNFQALDRGKVQVIARVPLYVTLVSASPFGGGPATGNGWTSIEHQTDMEFSFSYASVLLGHRGMSESKLALAVQPHVTRLRTDPNNGRLIIEFQTETRFAGRYHPSSSTLSSPNHLSSFLGFDLELVGTQSYPTGASVQKWRAVSNYTLQDYTGNYTLLLVPCISNGSSSGEKTSMVPAKRNYFHTYKEECLSDKDSLVNVTLPVHYQQPFRPEPVHFSLETTFQLTNDIKAFLRKPRSVNDIKAAEFDGSFHHGERVYGRVLWHPSNELAPGYRLWIEKLYLCAGRDGYVPLFEPNADQPQYGCLESSQRLKYRLLLLDRDDPYGHDRTIQGLNLEARFASQVEQLRTSMSHLPSMDGFVFSVDPLFQLEPDTRWFLQVSYSVQPVVATGRETGRWKRQQYSQQDGLRPKNRLQRRGTNFRLLPLDWHINPSLEHKEEEGSVSVVLASALIAGSLLILLVTIVFILLYVYNKTNKKGKLKRRANPPGTTTITKDLNCDGVVGESTPMRTENGLCNTTDESAVLMTTNRSIKTTLV